MFHDAQLSPIGESVTCFWYLASLEHESPSSPPSNERSIQNHDFQGSLGGIENKIQCISMYQPHGKA